MASQSRQLGCMSNSLFRFNKEPIKAPHGWFFVRGIYRWSADSLHKGPVMQKLFSYHNVSMMPLITKWWRHQMETCSASLTLCEGNPPVIGGFPSQSPAQRPVTRSFDGFFLWFETPSCSLWRHCNGNESRTFLAEFWPHGDGLRECRGVTAHAHQHGWGAHRWGVGSDVKPDACWWRRHDTIWRWGQITWAWSQPMRDDIAYATSSHWLRQIQSEGEL